PGRFFTINTVRKGQEQTRTAGLVSFAMDKEGEEFVFLFEATNVGMIRNPNGQGGFGDDWGTPNVFYGGDATLKRVYCGLNTEYRILVKDYSGKTLFVIEKSHENAKVSRGDVERMMPWALKDELSKWILSAYPDRLVAIKDVVRMPKGHLGVLRVTGAKNFEIDVFDDKGTFRYVLVPPAGVNMDGAQYFAGGFATVETDEDYSVYREYRIKNLPEIF
ncbi:MAG: hypothetical protein AB1649_34490, partial [Chloroflexota bacterium]